MKFSVLQWNVWFEEDIERVLDFLKQHLTDVICLQELTRGYSNQTQDNTWEYLARELGYYHFVQQMPIATPIAEWSQANGIFSRLPLLNTTSRWINEPQGSNGYDDQYRSYIQATVDTDEGPVTIATTHMSYTPNFITTPRKAQEIARLIECIDTANGPYIFTGDLNAQPNSPTIQEITKRLKHAGPDFSQNTWTTKPFSYDDFEAKTLDWRLDYIFCKDLPVVSSEIIKTDVSDHLPIRATFKLAQ